LTIPFINHLAERWQQFPDLVFSVNYYISIKSLELSFLRGPGGASPRIDPETYKLAAHTAQQEQDNKLTFLMRKLEVEDTQNKGLGTALIDSPS